MITTSAKYYVASLAGPSLVFSGYIFIVFGIFSLYFTWAGIGIIMIGAILAFSYSASDIDFKRRRYRSLQILAGVIPMGQWMDIEARDKVITKYLKASYTSYSRGNRISVLPVTGWQVVLIRDADGKQVVLAQFATREEADELKNRILTDQN